MRKKAVYAIYKGDEFLDMGTKKELAEKFKVSEQTIGFYITPSSKKRTKNYDKKIIAIRVEDIKKN